MLPSPLTMLRRAAGYFAQQTAIRDAERSWTFAEAWTRGSRLATALRQRGLQPRDRIATLEDNRIGAVDTYLAAVACNIVRAPLYPRNAVSTHAHMLKITGAKLLFVDEDMATPELLALVDTIPTLQEIIVRDAGYETWLAGHEPLAEPVQSEPDDLHIIRFSGGTTGLPKGIPLTNHVWLSQLRDLTYNLPPMEPGDICLHVGTLSHGAGYLFIPTWASGGVNELVVGFDPEKILDIMERDRVSYGFLAPSQLAALVRTKNAKNRDFSQLKGLWLAGAPISSETAMLSREVFGPTVYQTYNQTEISLGVAMPPNQWFADIPGSRPLEAAGRVGLWTDIEIRDEQNRALPTGKTGEIAFRTEGQMTGYIGDASLSSDKVVDGWILTGDIGYIDHNGFVYIVDRKGSMIISGGYNIYPAELERVISSLPGVIEVAVVAVPDVRWGETPLAVVMTEERACVSEAQVVGACKAELGSYKKPGRVIIQTDPLPMTPVGKVDRKAIKEPYWSSHTKRVAGI